MRIEPFDGVTGVDPEDAHEVARAELKEGEKAELFCSRDGLAAWDFPLDGSDGRRVGGGDTKKAHTDLLDGSVDLFGAARSVRTKDGLRVEENLGVESGKSRTLLERERRGGNVVHGEGDEASVPETHLFGVVEYGPGGEMVGAQHVRVRVVREMVAAPKPMEGAVIRSTSVTGVDPDFGFDIDGASETVTGARASGSDAGGAP